MRIDACAALVALARVRHFGRAAQLLHVSPSAVSVRLKELEEECGTRLVHREPQVSLTEAGEQLLPHCEALLEEMRQIQAIARRLTASVHGQVRLGASQTAGVYLLPGLLRSFQQAAPDATVALQIANSQEIIAAVDTGYLDFGLVESPTVRRLPRRRWLRDELLLVCAPDHPLAASPAVSTDDLRGCLVVMREAGSGTRQTIENALPAAILETMRVSEVASSEAIKRWVEFGEAVTFLSPFAVQREVELGRLVARRVAGLTMARWFTLVRRPEAFSTTAADAAFNFLLKTRPADGADDLSRSV